MRKTRPKGIDIIPRQVSVYVKGARKPYKVYESISQAAEAHGVSINMIQQYLAGGKYGIDGVRWVYVD